MRGRCSVAKTEGGEESQRLPWSCQRRGPDPGRSRRARWSRAPKKPVQRCNRAEMPMMGRRTTLSAPEPSAPAHIAN
jgi:hypothetical protein